MTLVKRTEIPLNVEKTEAILFKTRHKICKTQLIREKLRRKNT